MAYHSYFNFCKRIVELLWISPDSDLEIGGETFDTQLEACTSGYTSVTEIAKNLEEEAQKYIEKKMPLPNNWDLTDLKYHAEISAHAAEFYTNICSVAEQIRNYDRFKTGIKVDKAFHETIANAPSCSLDELEGLDDMVVDGDDDLPEGFVRV